MKNRNRIQNSITESQTTIVEPITPHPEPNVIGELLTLTEIDHVIKTPIVLSQAAAAGLAVCKGDLA